MTTTAKTKTAQGVLWVCADCHLWAANRDASGAEPGHVPWEREPDLDVTPGMAHDCDSPDSCEHETRDFSASWCEACTVTSAGTRHAYTWWA